MIQESFTITAVIAATILTAVFTTTPPFSMKDVEGQSLPSCPVGYERNSSGVCVPIVFPVPDDDDEDGSERGTLIQNQKGIASGEGEVPEL